MTFALSSVLTVCPKEALSDGLAFPEGFARAKPGTTSGAERHRAVRSLNIIGLLGQPNHAVAGGVLSPGGCPPRALCTRRLQRYGDSEVGISVLRDLVCLRETKTD